MNKTWLQFYFDSEERDKKKSTWKGYSGVSLIHVLTHRDTEYDPPPER